jgi:hypothetical protein
VDTDGKPPGDIHHPLATIEAGHHQPQQQPLEQEEPLAIRRRWTAIATSPEGLDLGRKRSSAGDTRRSCSAPDLAGKDQIPPPLAATHPPKQHHPHHSIASIPQPREGAKPGRPKRRKHRRRSPASDNTSDTLPNPIYIG